MVVQRRTFLYWLMFGILGFAVEQIAAEPSPNERVDAGAEDLMMTLPGCPSKCGDVLVPYPFGLRQNCSLPGFRVFCLNSTLGIGPKPKIRAEDILHVSLDQAQARVLIQPSKICDNAADSNEWFVNLDGQPFTFNTDLNAFVAIGCDTLALLQGTRMGDYTVGCISVCDTGAADAPQPNDGTRSSNQEYDQVIDNKCSGIGCCQSSIPPGLSSYYTTLRHLNINQTADRNISFANVSIGAPTSAGSCGYAFLVEKRNYSFKKSDLQRTKGRWILQAALDWAIGNRTCDEARANISSYACKSANSKCLNSNTGVGYFCNCNPGYHGNPYLVGGCQDIDECKDPLSNPCYKNGPTVGGPTPLCKNNPGNYTCTCPDGFFMLEAICIPYKQGSNKATFGIIVGLSTCGGALIFVTGGTLIYKNIKRRNIKKQKKKFFRHNYDTLVQQKNLDPDADSNLINSIKFFPLKDIQKATNNFDMSRIVGEGGHGTVYKGLLELKVVAIKKPKLVKDTEIKEFLNEVMILSQISHENVVQLIGCCIESEVPLLVYEFISNGTVFDHLHIKNKESPLSWNDRLRIATEISTGLSYIHTAAKISVLHRDIKSSNILLDERLTAKVSDFGASRTKKVDQTHISTIVQGTPGYIDPEYYRSHQLTDKSDVYGLGVILVELLTGQKPTSMIKAQEERSVIVHFMWAMSCNMLFDVIDHSILNDENKADVETFARLAEKCLSMEGKDRPTMQIVQATLEDLRK